MTREKLESFIGKKVEVKFFDNSISIGTLTRGNGFWQCPKYYNLPESHISFRLSHVKNIKIKGDK